MPDLLKAHIFPHYCSTSNGSTHNWDTSMLVVEDNHSLQHAQRTLSIDHCFVHCFVHQPFGFTPSDAQ